MALSGMPAMSSVDAAQPVGEKRRPFWGRAAEVIDRSHVTSAQTYVLDEGPEPLGELAQAKIRFGMNVAFILLGLLAYRHEPALGFTWICTTFGVCVLSALSLYVWARALSSRHLGARWRIGQRIASIIADNLAVTWLLFFGGQALAGAYGVYLWITIGYGMRFGLPYLYGNLLASMVGFLTVMQFSSFWSANPSLSIGLGIALLVVPIYAAFLISRLHTAVADARRAYAAKSDFVAKMSHELRTPLHGIISIADLLGRTEATIQQREMIRIVSVSSNTLLDLINRILDISKFEDGTFAIQREPMNLHTVINDTLTILWPQAREKGLELDFFIDPRIEPEIIGAPRQLQEVLINLCGNAVKFTDSGFVRLRVDSLPGLSDKVGVHFEIVDTGPGLTKEQLGKIFNPFYQADTTVTRKHGGTGLGTAIARELVRLMGGQISVDSAAGAGAVFQIDLVFDRAPKVPNLFRLFPVDVVVLGDVRTHERLRAPLMAFGVKVLELPIDESSRLSVTPTVLFVEVNAGQRTASEIRRSLCTNAGEILIPVCAFGPESARQSARSRGFNSFLAHEALTPGLERILDAAIALRKDYATHAVSSESRHRIKVLVAEDNHTNQTIARLALAEGGFDCTIVGDGESALNELASGVYGVALLDMHMPIMDGMEVARLYNFAVVDPALRIPLIMVTADSRPELIADAALAGITRYLTKPVKPSALIALINLVLREKNGVLPETTEEPYSVAPVDAPGEPLIDEQLVTELLDYMEGDDRVVFFAEFSEDARNYITTLASTGSASELDKIRANMHALCGAARTVGAAKLAACARRIEYMTGLDIANSGAALRVEIAALLADSEMALKAIAGIR